MKVIQGQTFITTEELRQLLGVKGLTLGLYGIFVSPDCGSDLKEHIARYGTNPRPEDGGRGGKAKT